LSLTFYPRTGRGILSFFSHILLFEAKGMPINDKSLEGDFVFQYNNAALAERFIKYPGIKDLIIKLSQYAGFSEMTINSDAGIYLAQTNSFNSIDLDVIRETLKLLGQIGQVLFEAF
jgi:hypothetical protein